MNTEDNQSNVAQLMLTIDLQNQAAQRMFSAPAMTASHAYINARMERIALMAQERREQVGLAQAIKEACAALDALCAEIERERVP